ncbi:MAG: PilZ domain-containing protein [Sphingomicrobium sp.]
MDQSGVIERRSSRSNVMLQATLEIPGASLPVVLRNLSQDGALVRGEDLPEAGTRVLFHRQGLSVPACSVAS